MDIRTFKGMRMLPAALPLLLFLCCAAAAHAAGREAGTVVSVTPGAFVERDGQRLPLEAKAAIYAGDVLVTDATGRLRAWMSDETTLSLGSDTEFEIEAYDDKGDKPVFTSRMTGLARMLTGKITQANPEGFKVTTPQATVGIRGTIFTVKAAAGRSGRTTVFVENTLRQVVVNGVTVPSGSKAEVPAAGAAPRVSPMTPADRQELGASLAVRGGSSGSGGGAGGASSGVTAASSSAAPAAAASAPAGLNVDNMLADSSSPLSQAVAQTLAQSQTINREATVTGSLVGGNAGATSNWSGSYTLSGVNLASGAFRSGAMMLHENNGAGVFNLSGGAGVLSNSDSNYDLSGTFSSASAGSIAATGFMIGTVHEGRFGAQSSNDTSVVGQKYWSTSVTH